MLVSGECIALLADTAHIILHMSKCLSTFLARNILTELPHRFLLAPGVLLIVHHGMISGHCLASSLARLAAS